jgi:hypothetical protein
MIPHLVQRPLDGTCGAKTRAGTPCRQKRGWRTSHPGQGRCHLHGGSTPIRHGLYSKIWRPSLEERLLRLPRPAQDLLRAAILDPTTRVEALHGAPRVVPLIDNAMRALIRGR